jgi:hypothetical protein
MSRWIWLLVVAFVAPLFAGCDSEVTEDDLDKWRYNERGLARMAQFVADPLGSTEMRTRALEIVVSKNNPKRIRGMLDETAAENGRDEIVKALIERLKGHLDSGSEVQIEAKDALMLLHRYVSAPDFVEIRKKVASWAFKGVTWEATAETVKKAVEGRALSSGQIADLGEYGYEGAAIILSHGFNVDKMIGVLTETRNDKATALLLKGMKGRHAKGEVAIHHLDAIAKTESGAAASYLLEIYLDEGKYDLDIRMPAFNRAMALMDKPGVKKEPADVADKLFKLMAGKDDQDRWFGATNIVQITGVGRLDEIMTAFKDDKAYKAYGDTHTEKWIVDFCLDVFDGGHAAAATPIFTKYLAYTPPNKSGSGESGNRIAAAISTVCLKALQANSAKGAFGKLSKLATPVSLADFLGGEYTLQGLATNASEGLDMMNAADKAAASGKLSKEDLPDKKKLISLVLESVGSTYATAVEERFAAYLASKAPAKPAAPAPAPPAAEQPAEKKAE